LFWSQLIQNKRSVSLGKHDWFSTRCHTLVEKPSTPVAAPRKPVPPPNTHSEIPKTGGEVDLVPPNKETEATKKEHHTDE